MRPGGAARRAGVVRRGDIWVFGQPPHFVTEERAAEMAAELETMPDDDHKRKRMRLVKARYPRPAPWLSCTMCTWVKSLVVYERIGWLVPPPKPPRKPRCQRSREEILRAQVKRAERELARLRREWCPLTATGLFCGSCGAQSSPTAKFCGECGTQLAQATQSAEYKQVTVLFADVVHSMDIAAAVGAERLREIMADLADRCAAVVQRYGGTVGGSLATGSWRYSARQSRLRTHAVRACLAALGVQEEAKRLAVEVHDCDGVDLQLRVGLNSGQVIAGEIGSGPFGYTAVGRDSSSPSAVERR